MAALAQTLTRDRPGPLGVIDPPDIQIECRAFSGSLATLFVCVREHKVDLMDVPLAPICEAYFRYVVQAADGDLEQAGVALAALAYLVERKAWGLLPVPESEEPEDEGLLDPIEPSVQAFGPVIHDLLELFDSRERLFFRQAEGTLPYEVPFDTDGVTSADLANALARLVSRAKPDPVGHLSRPRRSLSDQMVLVLKALPDEFAPLEEIVTGDFTRSEVVWWFLALLELIRLGQSLVKMDGGIVMFAKGSAH